MDGPALHHAQRIALLDCGESTVEDSGRALFRRTVAVPPGIFANLSAGAIFVLLRGIAASGTHTRVVVSCLEPVFSIVIAALVLGEILRPTQMIGIVIVLAAIIVVQLPDRKSRESLPAVEPIE